MTEEVINKTIKFVFNLLREENYIKSNITPTALGKIKFTEFSDYMLLNEGYIIKLFILTNENEGDYNLIIQKDNIEEFNETIYNENISIEDIKKYFRNKTINDLLND